MPYRTNGYCGIAWEMSAICPLTKCPPAFLGQENNEEADQRWSPLLHQGTRSGAHQNLGHSQAWASVPDYLAWTAYVDIREAHQGRPESELYGTYPKLSIKDARAEPRGKGRGNQCFAATDGRPMFFAESEIRDWRSVRR